MFFAKWSTLTVLTLEISESNVERRFELSVATFLMDHCKKINVNDYWFNDSLYKNCHVQKKHSQCSEGELISRDRYYIIKLLIYFSNTNQPLMHGKFAKVKHFVKIWNLCIDGSLVLLGSTSIQTVYSI